MSFDDLSTIFKDLLFFNAPLTNFCRLFDNFSTTFRQLLLDVNSTIFLNIFCDFSTIFEQSKKNRMIFGNFQQFFNIYLSIINYLNDFLMNFNEFKAFYLLFNDISTNIQFWFFDDSLAIFDYCLSIFWLLFHKFSMIFWRLSENFWIFLCFLAYCRKLFNEI